MKTRQVNTAADLEGAEPAPPPPPMCDGLTPSLTVLLICDGRSVLYYGDTIASL